MDSKLYFNFQATEYKGWPRILVYIDDDLYEDHTFDSEIYIMELPADYLDGDHTITVEIVDKTSEHTLVENGVIVADRLVTLDSIYYDGVCLPSFVKYAGRYFINNQPDYLSPCLTWGLNGRWILEFQAPIIDWVLDRRLDLDQTDFHENPISASMFNREKNRQVLAKLAEIEKLLMSNDLPQSSPDR